MGSRRERNRRMKKIAVLLRILIVSVFVGLILLIGVEIKTVLYKESPKSEQVAVETQKQEQIEQEEVMQEQIDEAIAQAQAAAEEELETSVSENEAEEAEDEEVYEHLDYRAVYSAEVLEKLDSMTQEEKVAQLFFVTPEALTDVDVVIAAGDATKEALEKYPVGGIIYFAQNIVKPGQTRTMLTKTQQLATEIEGMPIFLGTDEEGGKVLRIASNPKFPDAKTDAMGVLAAKGEDAVYEAAKKIGAYMKKYGFNVNFAPDADVLVNETNEVIGDRSFGGDATLVKDMASVYARAMQENGVNACYKHFPGHGGTEADSHTGKAVLDRTLADMKAAELVPFADAKAQGVPFIMASHISVPDIDGDTPACLSSKMVTGLLRDELGYDGIVITDALNMGAISDQYSSGEAAIKALQAGCDMLMMPENFTEAYDAVLKAIDDGTLVPEYVEAAVCRIIDAKLKQE